MPGYAGAWNLLGNLQQDSGDSEGALASYANAVRLVPDYVVAWCNLAGLLEAAGRRDEAGRAYDRALKADPACSDARLMRAQLDMDRRSFGEARRDYLACAQDAATEPEARWGLYRIDKIEGRPREAAQQLAGYYSAVRRRDESLQALAADGREQPSAYEPSLPPPESGANTPWESHP
jgi:tetratricopeptide (TPR) repeat protein